jgi:mannan polymerase II complex MNN10 subunit
MWESSRQKKSGGTGYPSFSTRNQSFFGRHMRRLSSSLPRFSTSPHYAEKEKLGRGRWSVHNVPLLGRIRGIMARMGRKMKMRLLIFFLILLSIYIFYHSRE